MRPHILVWSREIYDWYNGWWPTIWMHDAKMAKLRIHPIKWLLIRQFGHCRERLWYYTSQVLGFCIGCAAFKEQLGCLEFSILLKHNASNWELNFADPLRCDACFSILLSYFSFAVGLCSGLNHLASGALSQLVIDENPRMTLNVLSLLCYIANGYPKQRVGHIENYTNYENHIFYLTQLWNVEKAKDAQNTSKHLSARFLLSKPATHISDTQPPALGFWPPHFPLHTMNTKSNLHQSM